MKPTYALATLSALLACDVFPLPATDASTSGASTFVMGETSAPGTTFEEDSTTTGIYTAGTSGNLTEAEGSTLLPETSTTTSTGGEPTSSGSSSGADSGGQTSGQGPCGNGLVELGEECDGGDNCYNCLRDRIVFVAGTKFTPLELGGIEQANSICNKLAHDNGHEGDFKAWLSTPAYSPATHFKIPAGRYVRPDKAVVADSWDDLTDGVLTARILVDAGGEELGVVPVWTGTLPNGQWAGDFACSDWTATSGVGVWGGAPFYDSRWTLFGTSLECHYALSIYCFEQAD